ncbi:MAG TPA: hypothetical protein VJ437_12990 [Acidiferrobacterales bacterium]|nr:hypothetical protein [Acidiferrobacterales bacterium]
MNCLRLTTQRGVAALMAVLFLIFMLGVVLVIAHQMAETDVHDSDAQNRSVEAVFLAESGLEAGVYRYRNGTACVSPGSDLLQTLGSGSFALSTTTYAPAATTLSSAIVASGLVIPVASIAGYAPRGRIRIEGEEINYGGLSSVAAACAPSAAPCFTSAARGMAGTSAAAHANGTAVTQNQCVVTSAGTAGTTRRVLEGSMLPAAAFQAAGAVVSGTGLVNPAWPAHAIDDVALLFIESAGGQAATLSIPAGFVAVANSPQATGGGVTGTRITVFWARATSTAMATPRVADPGNHVYAQIITYRGVITTGNPWNVTGGGVKAAASTSVTVTGVTTTVPNTLIVQAVARGNDSAAAAFSAQTNANLTGITERSDAGTASGNGGGFAVWDGVKVTVGATGDTTATVTSSINAFLTIALRPSASYSRLREWGHWSEVIN